MYIGIQQARLQVEKIIGRLINNHLNPINRWFQKEKLSLWFLLILKKINVLLCISVLSQAAHAGEITHNNWYRPPLNIGWYWQLQGKVRENIKNNNVGLYNIDLFDTSSEKIHRLRQQGYKVICYFSAGSWEKWRPDAKAYPKYAIGLPLENWSGEYWLDIRDLQVRTLMKQRMILARNKGCDGVEADNVDAYLQKRTGFPIDKPEQRQFAAYLAHEAHHLQLAIGLKNAPDLVADLVEQFDFAVTERCHEHKTCHLNLPFIKAGKPVFNAEYAKQYHKLKNFYELCQYSRNLGMRTLLLPLKLDGSFRYSCND